MMVEPDLAAMRRKPPASVRPASFNLLTLLDNLEDYPGVETTILRTIRALLVWPLASWLLAREPVAHPHYLALGLLLALMSCSVMTKWVASAIIGVLLALVIVPEEAVRRATAALM